VKFEINILGCGGAMPTRHRNPSAQLINIQEHYCLMDCGEGTQMQIRRFGLRMQRIETIFISHLHGDHYLGLPGLLQTMHLLGRTKEVTVVGPPQLEQLLTDHFKLASTKGLRFPIQYIKTQAKTAEVVFENKKFSVTSVPLKHKIATTGFVFREQEKPRRFIPSAAEEFSIPYYRIDGIKNGDDFIQEDGTVIPNKEMTLDPEPALAYAYMSDTAYKESIVEHITGVNALYHEASFTEENRKRAKETFHSTASDAAKIAAMAKVKHLYLGHFSARYKNTDGFVAEGRVHFEDLTICEDGMTITL